MGNNLRLNTSYKITSLLVLSGVYTSYLVVLCHLKILFVEEEDKLTSFLFIFFLIMMLFSNIMSLEARAFNSSMS